MQTEKYRGYTLWGHAILQQEDILRPGRFAGSGTIMRDTKVVEVSGVLGAFETDEEAQSAGLSWCRAWIDSHG
ncbi:hypothetical protein SAMN05446935_10485 [Burkholderia sp. YR290]|jgi:hypothetical protein|uniref:hypothetical protein n=1 Tax=Paraburkholderia hospita TaxID=169430 RepID=UPI0009A61297|nr:hypothetical protein [Paraburkholderia hospita]SKC99748.1 hypothetical protein SAMN05446934_7933 [Paraburkholderia hospita]SOE91151.1 hypothetical protein SAMN05446935_10485 [Burkholderia sp. YR290]